MQKISKNNSLAAEKIHLNANKDDLSFSKISKESFPKEWEAAFSCEYWTEAEWLKIINRLATSHKSYPPNNEIFKTFELIPPSKTKVVILGQDPYHNPNQAHGLAFSVRNGSPAPPSLKNIFKELKSDLNIDRVKTDLTDWGEQGVLLLNSALTVEENTPGCDADLWKPCTDQILSYLSQTQNNLVFVLWGSFAGKKERLIDAKKHLVLKAPHPSPLSSYRGFFGSAPFSKINNFLVSKGQNSINC